MDKSFKSTLKLIQTCIKENLSPPPDLTVSEWADKFRVLPSETSAEPGQWDTSRAPYQREIMNAITDPTHEDVVIMSSAQVGKSEILLNALGYFIDMEPYPIMMLQPTEAAAKNFSKERLAPMFRVCPTLRNKVSNSKSRDGENTILQKSFPGGFIALAGANAPAGLASRSIRVLLADEIDRFPVSAGSEGDPLDLAEKRTTTFYNRKKVKVSTPTDAGTSRIEKEFELSTKERYHLPCPSCGHEQPLRWEQVHFDTVTHACIECGSMHNQFEWKNQEGRWVAEVPDATKRGFHLNELLSPWRKWEEIIAAFKDAQKKGKEALKVFKNTSLGEVWEEQGVQVDELTLYERREDYGCDVPEKVSILTAAVDVQDDRFEIEVVGWGPGKESWGIGYHIIRGDLNQPQVWMDLDEYLSRTWKKADGRTFEIASTFIDSGGHFTQEVYKFTRLREARRIYAIKGASDKKGEYTPLIGGHSRPKPIKAILIRLGVNDGKSKVMSSLQVTDFGPNYCHFPKGRGYNIDYFKALTAEKLETRFERNVAYQVWVKKRARNEAFDLRVYNTAALEMLDPNLDKEYTMIARPTRKRRRRVRK
ncbi:phage terminase large subunit family protein [Ureibacillus chungkukjangi]|uniref:phage terminase large subunit family protein n=1 Tax=Ureibacillus chungkukjangi TaxID=1202712 RepID=UPI00384D108D